MCYNKVDKNKITWRHSKHTFVFLKALQISFFLMRIIAKLLIRGNTMFVEGAAIEGNAMCSNAHT